MRLYLTPKPPAQILISKLWRPILVGRISTTVRLSQGGRPGYEVSETVP